MLVTDDMPHLNQVSRGIKICQSKAGGTNSATLPPHHSRYSTKNKDYMGTRRPR